MNLDHATAECFLQDYYAGDWVDRLDELKTNIDERMVVANAGAYALGRKSDELIIAAFDSATGTFSFPITGGNVDYYDPSSDVRPYVQGEIDHDGSGLSLTAADGTVVELSDFRIDPGESKLYGTVTANGAPVSGATVVITNVPSGTRAETTTDASGDFVQTGLRVGGPFTVDVTSPSGNTSVTDITLVG